MKKFPFSSHYLFFAFLILSACSCGKNHDIIESPTIENPPSNAFRVVGYLNTWDNFPNSINTVDINHVTHLNIAFAQPNASGILTSFTGLPTIISKAHSANVKVLMSLGGADLGGTAGNWKNLTNPANVNGFCTKILSYIQTNNLDGIDIDLEGDIIGNNYGNFIKVLSSSLKPNGKLVTAAVGTWFAENIPASSFAYFDFVNIMAYDKTGPWEPNHPGPHSSYSSAVSDLNFWLNKGLPKSKMVLGVPFYGWGFGNAFSQDEYSFKSIVANYPGAENKDKAGNTIYYNGIPTIKNKTTLALQNASGIMIWQITEDASGSKSLLTSIHSIITGK